MLFIDIHGCTWCSVGKVCVGLSINIAWEMMDDGLACNVKLNKWQHMIDFRKEEHSIGVLAADALHGVCDLPCQRIQGAK